MITGMKRLGPIIAQQKARDVSEADTVTLVKDLMHDVLGYDKYADLTGEVAIRGTYCDLAVKSDNKVIELVEVKAIGISLEDRHVKQAVDYASNQGIEWVVLTNAINWRLARLEGAQPTGFVGDERVEAWLDFDYRGHHFSVNDQLDEYWFFVADPLCPDDVLLAVLTHFGRLLENRSAGLRPRTAILILLILVGLFLVWLPNYFSTSWSR